MSDIDTEQEKLFRERYAEGVAKEKATGHFPL